MKATVLRDILEGHFHGAFDLPSDVSPTAADIEWFRMYGRSFRRPVAHPTFRGRPRECMRNATDALWHEPALSYVQGFVQGRGQELLLHAWCTNANGDLLEVTWDVANATGDEVYFGVSFTLAKLVRLQLHFETYDWYQGFADVLDGGGFKSPAGG